jgi:hypothetical protein
MNSPRSARTLAASIVGMREGTGRDASSRSGPMSGLMMQPGFEEPAMFKLPAYDPIGIAMLGFGILAIVALAFTF